MQIQRLFVPMVMLALGCSSNGDTPAILAAVDAGADAPAADAGADVVNPPTEAGADGSTSSCALTANTTPGATHNGCVQLTRDTSSCAAARTAAGLSGFWLKFSCRVTLGVSGGNVTITGDGQPDYKSVYFAKNDACYTSEPGATPNPNVLAIKSTTMTVPLNPSGGGQAMGFGAVGMATNGVTIFDNQAAPGDDIFLEAATFDHCAGHPTPTSVYHYHSEPYALSYDDAAFIGVMRDGNPVYGRRDADNSLPKLDAAGGHSSATPDSSKAVYHYHVNLQTSTSPKSAGTQQWFLTTGTYHSAPGTCTGCQ